jgi:hypothetical protein
MLVRLPSTTCIFLVTVVASMVVVNASEPRLRAPEAKSHVGNGNTNSVDGFIKAEIDVEKGMKCKGKVDPIKKGADKVCEGGMKKTMSIGIGTNEVVEDIATEMNEMYQSMMPNEKSLLPSDETMMELMNLEDEELLLLSLTSEDGEGDDDPSSTMTKTVSFGGYFKVFWGCNVTFTKEGMKMSKNIDCGAKSFEGMGKKPDDDDNDNDNDNDNDKILYVEEGEEEEKKF